MTTEIFFNCYYLIKQQKNNSSIITTTIILHNTMKNGCFSVKNIFFRKIEVNRAEYANLRRF